MLLTSIGTDKNTGPRLCETSVIVGVDILDAFIDEIQVDLMTGIKGGACKTMDGPGTSVCWRKSQEKTYLP
jgi:hypothetical protein